MRKADFRNHNLYVFFHIPKTGGTTLRDHFNLCLRPHDEFIHLGPEGIADATRLGLPPFDIRGDHERRRAFVILGHHVNCRTQNSVPGKQPRNIVFLRDPAEETVFSTKDPISPLAVACLGFDELEELAVRAGLAFMVNGGEGR